MLHRLVIAENSSLQECLQRDGWSSGAFVADVGWGGVNRTNEAEVECWGKNTEAGHTEDLEMNFLAEKVSSSWYPTCTFKMNTSEFLLKTEIETNADFSSYFYAFGTSSTTLVP